jgi:hypothetical protein
MPYIKISDPNTIDLASWHQVVNVVNQHSDSINAITNNFGIQGNGLVDWNDGSSDFAYEYDPGSQKMLFGRTKIDTRDGSSKTSSTTGDHMFYKDIEFATDTGTGAFSAKPVVTVTGRFGDTDNNPPSLTNANVVATVIAVTNEKFTVRVVNARSTTGTPIELTGFFYINWVAVGPK